jgi:hypothetical protein
MNKRAVGRLRFFLASLLALLATGEALAQLIPGLEPIPGQGGVPGGPAIVQLGSHLHVGGPTLRTPCHGSSPSTPDCGTAECGTGAYSVGSDIGGFIVLGSDFDVANYCLIRFNKFWDIRAPNLFGNTRCLLQPVLSAPTPGFVITNEGSSESGIFFTVNMLTNLQRIVYWCWGLEVGTPSPGASPINR